MILANLKPYPTYKNSSIEWLSDVPESWNTTRVKALAKPGYKTFVDGDWIESPFITDDGIRLIQTGNIGVGKYVEKGFRYIHSATFDRFGCTEVEPGDVLICRLGQPVARACIAPDLGHRMITSVDVCILKSDSTSNARFLVYAMLCQPYLDWVGSLVRGSTRDRISRTMLGAFLVPRPSQGEQSAIVRFLNHFEGRIRRHISIKERLIELLEEQRQSIIRQAVTGQIDVRTGQPYPTYRDSGVDWLGLVPEHWKIMPLKHGARCSSGEQIRADNVSSESDVSSGYQVPVIGANGRIGFSVTGNVDVTTIAIGRVGACGTVRVVEPPAWVTDNALICHVNSRILELQYVAAVLRIRKLNELANKSAQPLITGAQVRVQRLPVPPQSEQALIVSFVNSVSTRMKHSTAQIGKQIALLREYRTRLIADAVTGKLDVREAAAKLPGVDPSVGGNRVDAFEVESNTSEHDGPQQTGA